MKKRNQEHQDYKVTLITLDSNGNKDTIQRKCKWYCFDVNSPKEIGVHFNKEILKLAVEQIKKEKEKKRGR